jgi:hypothetical protein
VEHLIVDEAALLEFSEETFKSVFGRPLKSLIVTQIVSDRFIANLTSYISRSNLKAISMNFEVLAPSVFLNILEHVVKAVERNKQVKNIYCTGSIDFESRDFFKSFASVLSPLKKVKKVKFNTIDVYRIVDYFGCEQKILNDFNTLYFFDHLDSADAFVTEHWTTSDTFDDLLSFGLKKMLL